MDEHKRDLTACCGLYCGDCIRYKSSASELAMELLTELERLRFDEYAKVKSRSVKEFLEYDYFRNTLKMIYGLKCDVPCGGGGDGCGQPCEIKACAASNSLQGCWECEEYEGCDKFRFLEPFHGNAAKINLGRIREYGLNKWLTFREKCYPWFSDEASLHRDTPD